MNIVTVLLSLLPEAEQIALLFIHNASSAQKYSLVTGAVNDVAPIAAGLIAGIASATGTAASAAASATAALASLVTPPPAAEKKG